MATSLDDCFLCLYEKFARILTALVFAAGGVWATTTAAILRLSPRLTELTPRWSAAEQSLGSKALKGKTCVVTGGASGIGREIAIQLAEMGARVIVVDIDKAEAEKVVAAILTRRGSVQGDIIHADFSDMNSVRAAAALVKEKCPQIDALVNNAGVGLQLPTPLSADGYHRTFAVNFMGPYLFTKLLLPHIEQSGRKGGVQPVIIVTSSITHRMAIPMWMACAGYSAHQPETVAEKFSAMMIATLKGERQYDTYPCSKLALLMAARHFNNRALIARKDDRFLPYIFISVNPGSVLSGIWKKSPYPLLRKINSVGKMAMLSPEQGAKPAVNAIVAAVHAPGNIADATFPKKTPQLFDPVSTNPLYLTPYLIPPLPRVDVLRDGLSVALKRCGISLQWQRSIRQALEAAHTLMRALILLFFEVGGPTVPTSWPATPSLPPDPLADDMARTLCGWADAKLQSFLLTPI